jgi:TRAP-type C4-dicarboxylate transport system substrate-binding protein
MRRRVVQLALGLLTAAALAPPAAPAATVRAVPTAGETPLLPGTYAANGFTAPFSLTVTDDAWRVDHAGRRDIFLLHGAACCDQNAGRRTGILAAIQPRRVIDPRSGKLLRAPSDLARWLRGNPHLKVVQGPRLRVAGRSVRRLDVRFRSRTPDNEECANIAVVTFGRFGVCPEESGRMAVVKVGRRPVLFFWTTAPAARAQFERPARSLLGTVRFGRRGGLAPRPRVLVIGNSDPTSDDELFFAREAARRSGGALQVSLRSELYGDKPDSEQRVARAVRAGRLPLAWDATRVWDIEGVLSFQGLQAPFLIDSVALMDRVIASPLAAQAASGLAAKGVVSLGLAAVNLRRPLGAKRSFRSLADFSGAKVNVISSKLSRAVVTALGAKPMEVGGGEDLAEALRTGKVDAAETAIDVVFRNGYSDVAKFMTSNVVLFPKFASIDANAPMVNGLAAPLREALAGAAAATGPHSSAGLADLEDANAAALCRQGIRFASATQAQLDALAAAEKPVYDTLAAAAGTASLIDGIRVLKQQGGLGAGLTVPANCRG